MEQRAQREAEVDVDRVADRCLVIAVPLLIVIAGVLRLIEGYRPAVIFIASSLITLLSSVAQNLCQDPR